MPGVAAALVGAGKADAAAAGRCAGAPLPLTAGNGAAAGAPWAGAVLFCAGADD
jgi:hypothetical protein